MKALHAALIALAATAAGAVQAQTQAGPEAPWTPHPYVGIDATHTSDAMVRHGFVPKLFGGVDFANNVGIEAGYVALDTYHTHSDFGDYNYDATEKGYNAYVAGKYTWALSPRIAAYAKLGLGRSEREFDSSYTGGNTYRSKGSGNGLYEGIGLQYKLTENVALKAEYEHYGGGAASGAKPGMWSLGVKVGF